MANLVRFDPWGMMRDLDRLFEEGGRLEPLQPLWEAADTFLYTPGQVTRCHLPSGRHRYSRNTSPGFGPATADRLDREGHRE